VTTVADAWDHADDLESLSIREAVDLVNQAGGAKEIWVPAWAFTLTRDRQTYGGGSATDLDAAFGDLDVLNDALVVRGVADRTSVKWKEGVVDSVFDLLGDANQDGATDQDVNSADYVAWGSSDGSGSGTPADWEVYAADVDDDGDVDDDDKDIIQASYGRTLDLVDVDA